jgi:hypothetical protein
MNTARSGETAALLASGKVLFAGGADSKGNLLSSTELYDPATNSFAAPAETASMNTARGGASATPLLSGKVLIAGGSTETDDFPYFASLQPLSSTELYDPVTNSFAAAGETASMNNARAGAQAILLPAMPALLPWTLDFGTVEVGQFSPASMVTLTNGTRQRLAINRAAVGHDFVVSLRTCPTMLEPGQSCNYWVIFHPQTAGTKNELFQLFDKASDSPQTVILHGIAEPR